jgi:hypothetical protein
MSDEINRTLGEIKGTLVQFQRDTERRFDDLKDVIRVAHDRAEVAEKKAEEAQKFAQGIINRARWTAATFAVVFSTLAYFIKNKALAAILGMQ